MKIYTRTGDTGTSGLYNGDRLNKDDIVFECLGDLDECSATLGLAVSKCCQLGNLPTHELNELWGVRSKILGVQSRLLDLGAFVATPRDHSSTSKLTRTTFDTDSLVKELEESIDYMETKLEPLKTFILPGGCPMAADVHLARTVARRTERHLVQLSRQDDNILYVIPYVNRLSDWLFVAARYINVLKGDVEIPWKKC